MRAVGLVLAGATALTGCSSLGGQLADVVFVPNAHSAKTADETTDLELAFSGKPAPEEVKLEIAGAAPAIAAAVVDQIGKTLAAEAERYQATYSAEASGDRFYHTSFDPSKRPTFAKTNIRLAGFKISRHVKVRGKNEAAMAACFIAIPGSTDAYFYIVPVAYDIPYAKAKMVAFDLTSPFGVDVLNPWEIITDPLINGAYEAPPKDKDIDLKFSVSLQNLYFDKDGKLGVTNIAADPVSLKNVEVGKINGEEKRDGYFPAYRKFQKAAGENFAYRCDDAATPEALATLRDKIVDLGADNATVMTLIAGGRAFASPKPALPDRKTNANFLVRVAVEETDEFAARVKELNAAFEKEKPTIQKGLSDFLDGKK